MKKNQFDLSVFTSHFVIFQMLCSIFIFLGEWLKTTNENMIFVIYFPFLGNSAQRIIE